MKTYLGGCACGLIKYEMQEEPGFSFHCQCRRCQRALGAGHASQFMIPVSAVSITGDVRYFRQQVEDGNTVSHAFCPQCGSPLFTKTTMLPESLFIHAASLDDPSVFKPGEVMWHSSAQPWDFVDPALEKS